MDPVINVCLLFLPKAGQSAVPDGSLPTVSVFCSKLSKLSSLGLAGAPGGGDEAGALCWDFVVAQLCLSISQSHNVYGLLVALGNSPDVFNSQAKLCGLRHVNDDAGSEPGAAAVCALRSCLAGC